MKIKEITFILMALILVAVAIKRTYAANIPKITVDEVKELIDKKADVFLLDVRTDKEYNEGRIEGVVLIPIGELKKRISEVPKDKDVIAICAVGGRSFSATKILLAAGYTRVFNMVGGMSKWIRKSYPTVK